MDMIDWLIGILVLVIIGVGIAKIGPTLEELEENDRAVRDWRTPPEEDDR